MGNLNMRGTKRAIEPMRRVKLRGSWRGMELPSLISVESTLLSFVFCLTVSLWSLPSRGEKRGGRGKKGERRGERKREEEGTAANPSLELP
jgi:hypothetical protein